MDELRIRVQKELREWLKEESKRKGLTVTALVVTALWDRKERSFSGVNEDKKRSNRGLSAAKVKFEPPSRGEAEEWHRLKGYHFDLEEWFAYYEARNWIPNGRKTQTPSWKALMVTFEANWKRQAVAGGVNGQGRRLSASEQRARDAINELNELYPLDSGAANDSGAGEGRKDRQKAEADVRNRPLRLTS